MSASRSDRSILDTTQRVTNTTERLGGTIDC